MIIFTCLNATISATIYSLRSHLLACNSFPAIQIEALIGNAETGISIAKAVSVWSFVVANCKCNCNCFVV